MWRLLECNRMRAAACTNGDELAEIVDNRRQLGVTASELADLVKVQGIDEVDADNYVAGMVFIWWAPLLLGCECDADYDKWLSGMVLRKRLRMATIMSCRTLCGSFLGSWTWHAQ